MHFCNVPSSYTLLQSPGMSRYTTAVLTIMPVKCRCCTGTTGINKLAGEQTNWQTHNSFCCEGGGKRQDCCFTFLVPQMDNKQTMNYRAVIKYGAVHES